MPQPRPSAGRPRKADVPSPADDSKPHAAASELYRACKDHLAACPSAAEIAAIDDPEQAAFRIAVADFFLQRKQSELVRQGVF